MTKKKAPEIEVWSIGDPSGGTGLWRPRIPDGSGVRVYVVFPTREAAEEHAKALVEDEGPAREWVLSRVRKVNPREIPRTALVSDGVTRHPNDAIAFSLTKWSTYLDERLVELN